MDNNKFNTIMQEIRDNGLLREQRAKYNVGNYKSKDLNQFADNYAKGQAFKYITRDNEWDRPYSDEEKSLARQAMTTQADSLKGLSSWFGIGRKENIFKMGEKDNALNNPRLDRALYNPNNIIDQLVKR